MTAKTKGFLLYPNQWPALSRLSEVKLGMLLTAIFDYMNNPDDVACIEAKLDNDAAIAFRFMRLQLDIDDEKYQQRLANHRERQRRYREKMSVTHGDARDAQEEKEEEKEDEKEVEVEVDKEVDVEVEVEKEDESAADAAKNKNAREAREASAAAQQDIFLKFKEEAPTKIMPWTNGILKDADSKIPRLRYMTRQRVRRLYDLWQQYGNAAIGEALRKAARSPFLNGRGKRNKFVADIDWVLSEQHFLEVLEGKYNTE